MAPFQGAWIRDEYVVAIGGAPEAEIGAFEGASSRSRRPGSRTAVVAVGVERQHDRGAVAGPEPVAQGVLVVVGEDVVHEPARGSPPRGSRGRSPTSTSTKTSVSGTPAGGGGSRRAGRLPFGRREPSAGTPRRPRRCGGASVSAAIVAPSGDQKNATTSPPSSVRDSPAHRIDARSGPSGKPILGARPLGRRRRRASSRSGRTRPRPRRRPAPRGRLERSIDSRSRFPSSPALVTYAR